MIKEKKDFYPDYLIEILITIFVIVELMLFLALLFPPAIGRPIDFSAPYQPLPEWYFYWLFQLVRYFSGALTFLGAVLFPVAAFLTLMLIPFIDRGKRGRIIALCTGFGLLVVFIVLTLIPALKY